ncbi:hypothetical protein TWF225_002859 [Orbilia oligospora]|uniref:Uncharacterized protein n=1 Tax=Orbilia oligospora TaxID=2813651 RepID=A0A7C8KIF4_ORBOL|nr:hypothetical protein TWF751_004037 [Orbilia oligospora]KAF3189725.1 hypothetical protein TWF225_002859 [Orbilia oligospora]KAF3253319.1 hypothetical protein TWF128_006413 [Orbilia oligospora]KAF3263778.1 hypothetical protein TWF217_003484 [Orbilia oligospora]KAF3297981.1 hypothetical protein TWF132_004127 [Orbilia oligospora]
MTSNATYNQATSGAEVAAAYKSQVTGRNILITGVSPNGIGSAGLEALAAQSPNLITVTGRSVTKLNESIAQAKAAFPEANIRPLIMDLSSIESVRKAAAEFNATSENLDILINNAGVMTIPTRTLSVDGIEMQFATNHVGHYVFTCLILPKLIAAAKNSPKGATRIINVSSYAHVLNPIRFSDHNWEGREVPEEEKGDADMLLFFQENDVSFTKYTAMGAYGQSKTANALFSVELTRRLYEKHGILSLALHPGAINSNLGRHMTTEQIEYWSTKMTDVMFFKSTDQGTSTTLVAALDPKLNDWEKSVGYYLVDCQFATPKAWAVNEDFGKRLWTLSEEIVGERFDY